MNETEEDNKSEQVKVETPADEQKAEAQKPVSESAEPAAAVTAEPVAAETAGTESPFTAEPGDETKDSESKAAEAQDEASEPVKEAPKKKKAKAAKKEKPVETLNISEDKNWYVVQAFSGYEASVKRSLLERIERAGLSKDFGEILVPTEEVVEIRGGQKRKSERCLLYTSPSPRDS